MLRFKWLCAFLAVGVAFNNCSSDHSSQSEFEQGNSSSLSSSSESTSLPNMLPPAGFYDSLTVNPPTAQLGGVVRCTFDGSEPKVSTATLDLAKTITTNTVVRCYEFTVDSVVHKETQTYFIGENVQLPVVAVTVAPEFYTDYWTASTCKPDPCYSAKFWETDSNGDDIEFPTHVEYFENGSASTAKNFEIDAGISISGSWSRNFEKRSVSISMRKKYQDGRLHYPLFETRPENNKFKGFMLRNGGQRFVSDFVDEMTFGSLLEGSGIDYQRGRSVVVFANGVYLGIFGLRETLNEHFVETNYGMDSKGVNSIKHVDGKIEANGGSAVSYLNLLHYAFTTDLSDSSNFAQIQTMMDVPEFADYIAAQIYYENSDWPNNNVRAWQSANQPWRFAAYDLDFSYDWTWTASGFGSRSSMFEWIRTGGGESNCSGNSTNEYCFHNLYVSLEKNAEFKRMLANHAAVLYTKFLNYEKLKTAVDAHLASIPQSEMDRDMDLYPRSQYWYRNACGNGFETDGACIKSTAMARDASVWQEFKDEYNFGDDINASITATGNGHVTLDGMKLPSSNYTGKFFGGNAMLLTAVSDGGIFTQWEDGSKANPRLVMPVNGSAFVAKFQ